MRAASVTSCFLLLATLLVACGGGIGRDEATEIALRESGAGGATVVRAERGPLLRFALGLGVAADEPWDREAWGITLSGTFLGECVLNAAGESVCPPVAGSKLVVLDARTGAFIFSASPAP